jgi:hypothetical protein
MTPTEKIDQLLLSNSRIEQGLEDHGRRIVGLEESSYDRDNGYEHRITVIEATRQGRSGVLAASALVVAMLTAIATAIKGIMP